MSDEMRPPSFIPHALFKLAVGLLCAAVGCAQESATAPSEQATSSQPLHQAAVGGSRAERPGSREGRRWHSGSDGRTLDPGPSTVPSAKAAIHIARYGDPADPVLEVTGLTEPQRQALQTADWNGDSWTHLLAVYVGSEPAPDALAVLGRYDVVPGGVRFTPRFAFEPGLTYVAVFHPDRLPEGGPVSGTPIVRRFAIPARPAAEATVVQHVYPSRDKLPENLLKFYLHFSAPMSQGDVYRYLHVIDDVGSEVDYPFLRLEQELWDPTGTRLTVLFDPGRIKRGLKPREDVGPVLKAGKTYTLLIDRDWPDATGQPLKAEFRKTFHVTTPDETQPDPKKWTMHAPTAETSEPLQVQFNEPLDHAMLNRVLTVTDADRQPLSGTIAITDEETHWQFRPDKPWQAGPYALVVETTLEDLAGNSIGRLFEVDVFDTVQRTVESETVSLPFHVKR